ncbi:MAG: DUF6116 family protein [Wenzhouxiangellaceae bacterium]|nr:DUF6116 family protein [Wenzhouxiangellaceae bacterium]
MIPKSIKRFLERRRFPTLLLFAFSLFLINVFIPDPLPFVDELLMLLATIILGSVRGRRKPDHTHDAR